MESLLSQLLKAHTQLFSERIYSLSFESIKPLLEQVFKEAIVEEISKERNEGWVECKDGGWPNMVTAVSIPGTISSDSLTKLPSSCMKKRKSEHDECNGMVLGSCIATVLSKKRKGRGRGVDQIEQNCSSALGYSPAKNIESFEPATPESLEQAVCISDSELLSHVPARNMNESCPIPKKRRSSLVQIPCSRDFPGADFKVLLGSDEGCLQTNVSNAKRLLEVTQSCQKYYGGQKGQTDQMRSRTKSLTLAFNAFEEAKRTKPLWREVPLSGVDYRALIGLACEVYWPLDVQWYPAVVQGYNRVTRKHKVLYGEGECEWLLLSKERVKLLLPGNECLHSTCTRTSPTAKTECNFLRDIESGNQQLTGVEKRSRSYGSLSHGDVVWGKVKGYPEWPALVLDDEEVVAGSDDPKSQNNSTVTLQYFGTFDISVQSKKSCRLFSDGVKASLHTKNHRLTFVQALNQAERYLMERILPPSMAAMARSSDYTMSSSDFEDEEDLEEDQLQPQLPLVIGTLTVLSLGKVVFDSEHFHSDKYIWPEGYRAVRMFPSSKDVTKTVEYQMEVLRKPGRKGPLFRVTPADGKPEDGDTPGACWTAVQRHVIQAKEIFLQTGSEISLDELPSHTIKKGPAEFGFSSDLIASLIQALPNAHKCTKFVGWLKPRDKEVVLPAGYVPQCYTWQHGDRCSVCYTHEEYEDNQLLQCDNCRMMVHMDCYGVDERPDGDLWLCDVCDTFSSKSSPPCRLCPVQGGAMKRTSDGCWAHVACAIWIPETTFEDMKVIAGVAAVNKARWKLLCSICRVPYGACIQCVAKGCCVAYHPLCARKEGLPMELTELNTEHEEHKRRRCTGSVYSNLQLSSYCRRHKKAVDSPSPGKPNSSVSTPVKTFSVAVEETAKWQPAVNPSGSARTEPYNPAVRRGRREPDAIAAAMAKRNFLENVPYIISGCREASLESVHKVPRADFGRAAWALHWTTGTARPRRELDMRDVGGTVKDGVPCFGREESEFLGKGAMAEQAAGGEGLLSMSDRFRKMQGSLHSRLAFGKSAIHGWGLLAKRNHKAGDMMIEYAGEIVRPIVADIRERRCYDSLVGAGTYMFRIDTERVVDATRRGSMAHLINHSCEPNCYSRVVKAGKEDHIIIFAKRDICVGEELSYDYRFNSRDELLPCNCGSARCRGVVNIYDEDDSLMAKRSDLTPWGTPFAS